MEFSRKRVLTMTLKHVISPIQADLRRVEEVLASVFSTETDESLQVVAPYVLQSHGKRLRPSLVILSARVVHPHLDPEETPREVIQTAAAMELIHLASLIHDDVVDGATLRRHVPTLNEGLGSSVSIIFGDWVYAQALSLISSVRSAELFQCICTAISAMCQGELTQVVQRDNWNLTEEDAIEIARNKTGALFGASCRAGAILAQADVPTQVVLQDYGLHLGIGYQLADDCRDIVDGPEVLGKHPGQDEEAGDVTLPLLYRRRQGQNPSADVMVDCDPLQATREQGLKFLEQARETLQRLSPSTYRGCLESLVEFFSESF